MSQLTGGLLSVALLVPAMTNAQQYGGSGFGIEETTDLIQQLSRENIIRRHGHAAERESMELEKDQLRHEQFQLKQEQLRLAHERFVLTHAQGTELLRVVHAYRLQKMPQEQALELAQIGRELQNMLDAAALEAEQHVSAMELEPAERKLKLAELTSATDIEVQTRQTRVEEIVRHRGHAAERESMELEKDQLRHEQFQLKQEQLRLAHERFVLTHAQGTELLRVVHAYRLQKMPQEQALELAQIGRELQNMLDAAALEAEQHVSAMELEPAERKLKLAELTSATDIEVQTRQTRVAAIIEVLGQNPTTIEETSGEQSVVDGTDLAPE